MRSEVASKSDFDFIRYAQCWEDADVLLEALQIRPNHTCLSIASAGDNAIAMAAQGPQRVIALDLSAAQLACLELRVVAYRVLEHAELLELYGSRESTRRGELFRRCRAELSPAVRDFWDDRPADIDAGFAARGKFEHYFALFRRFVLPLVHGPRTCGRLLKAGSEADRIAFYDRVWNSWRWRLLFRLFFSKRVMGRLGRDPRFFDYVDGPIGDGLLERSRHALTVLDPSENPYLTWIITGRHGAALPYALRPENFAAVRAGLDRLEWRCASIETFLDAYEGAPFDRLNLSDIFEYMSEENYRNLLGRILRRSAPGARLAYWNMMAPRHRPPEMGEILHPLTELADALHARDKAFFYRAFVLEEKTA
jgi:S-adenosylmethionine-diacylglycerol 3-amino-3-carboxypropyl transferase